MTVEGVGGLAQDATWGGRLSGRPRFAGIQTEDHEGVTLRVTVQTRPGQDAPVARQARLRILQAWRRAGIAWDAPPPGQ